MNPKWLRIAPLIIMLLLLMALALGLVGGNVGKAINRRLIGYNIAPFDIPALGSDAHFSPAAWQGRVAVLNIFASWCKPCAAEHAELMKLAQAGKVAIYGLAWKDKPEAVTAWLRARGNPYQLIGIDEYAKTTVATGIIGVPETFLLDKNGAIAYHVSGTLTADVVDNVILPMAEKLNAQ